MKKPLVITIVIVLVIVVAVIALNGSDSSVDQNPSNADKTNESVQGSVKSFTMTAKQWEFDPSTITVNQGDKVKLVITSVDVAHGISIPDFNVSTFLSPGRATEIEFVADKAGTYSFFCNVSCGVGHGNMRGTLIVQ